MFVQLREQEEKGGGGGPLVSTLSDKRNPEDVAGYRERENVRANHTPTSCIYTDQLEFLPSEKVETAARTKTKDKESNGTEHSFCTEFPVTLNPPEYTKETNTVA